MNKFLIITFFSALFLLLQSCEKNSDVIYDSDNTGDTAASVLDSLEEEDGLAESRSSLFKYNITMTGKTFGAYNFSRKAELFVVNGIKAAGSKNINNGINPYDVGFKSGSPASNPVIGSIWYGTNTAMCSYMNIGCNTIPANAALDLAFVKWINSKTLQIDLDGRYYNNSASGAALLGFLNIFNATSGLFSKAFRITTGRILITFESNGSVKGTINITGSSLGGLEPVSYVASFSGKKA